MKHQEQIMKYLAGHERKKFTLNQISDATNIKGKKDKLATVRGRLCMLFNNGFVRRGSLSGEVAYWTTRELYEKFANSKTTTQMVKAVA